MSVHARMSKVVLCMVALFWLAGCGSLHLHSAAREERGKTAQKDWAEASASALDLIKVERENSAAMLVRETTLVQNALVVSRDMRLYALTTGPLATNLVGPVDSRGKALLGPWGPNDLWSRINAAKETEASFWSQLQEAQVEVRRAGFEAFSCADLVSGQAEQTTADWVKAEQSRVVNFAGAFKSGLRAAKTLCTDNISDSTALRDLVTRELAAFQASEKAKNPAPLVPQKPPQLLDAMGSLHEAEEAFAKKTGMLRAGDRNAYRAALLEYQRVLAAPDRDAPVPPPPPAPKAAASAAAPPASGASSAAAAASPASAASDAAAAPPKTKTKADVALEKLQASIEKLKTFDDKFSLKLLAEERYDAITETLTALTAPKAATDASATDKDRAGRAFQRLSQTLTNWKDVQKSAQEVRMRPLLMQQALDGLQAEALGRAIALDAAKLQLQRDKVALKTRQALHYHTAHASLSQGLTAPNTSLTATLKDKLVPENERTRIVSAVAHYGYAVGDLESQIQVKDLQAHALAHEHSLASSENAIRQWNTLIGGNVELLTAWTQTGVKEEALARYLNTFLLFALLWKAY